MQVKMKRFEYLAGLFGKRFTKSWEYYILSSDAYLSGYRQAIEDYKNNRHEEEVELNLENGEHQLSIATFEKWAKERV